MVKLVLHIEPLYITFKKSIKEKEEVNISKYIQNKWILERIFQHYFSQF